MHTKREAARALGMDLNTLTKWMERCGIRGADDPLDKRVRVVSDDDLLTIRGCYTEARRRYADSPRIADADLEQRVAQLEAVIATLRDRAPYLFSASERPVTPPASVSRDNVLPLHGERQNRGTAPRVRPPARGDTFPEGWVSVSTWAERHGLNGRAVDFQIEQGVLPVPKEGRWKRGPNTIKLAYTLEQHAAADRAAASFWPDRFRPCGILDTTDAADATTPQRSEED